MRRISALMPLVLLLSVIGCSPAPVGLAPTPAASNKEIVALKEEVKACEKKSKADLDAKDDEFKKLTAEYDRQLNAEKDRVAQLEKARTDMALELGKVKDEINSLIGEKKGLNMEIGTLMRAHGQAKDGLEKSRAQLQAAQSDIRDRDEKIRSFHDLEVKYKKIIDNPSFDIDPKSYPIGRQFYLAYAKGKLEDAKLLCQALSVEIKASHEKSRFLTCQHQLENPMEMLMVLNQRRSVFTGMQSDEAPSVETPSETDVKSNKVGERGTKDVPERTRDTGEGMVVQRRRSESVVPKAFTVSFGRDMALDEKPEESKSETRLPFISESTALSRDENLKSIHSDAISRAVNRHFPRGSNEGKSIPTGARPAEEITVAVIDSAFDVRHPLLKDNYNKELSRNFADVKRPMDLLGSLPEPNKDYREAKNINLHHGTHCASLFLKTVNLPRPEINDLGKRGPRLNLLLLRIMDKQVTQVADAIEYALDHGAKVISMSLAYGPGTFQANAEGRKKYIILRQACVLAAEKGCLIVCAAGNANLDLSTIKDPQLPAALSDPNSFNSQLAESDLRDEWQIKIGEGYDAVNVVSDYILPVSGFWIEKQTGESESQWKLKRSDSSNYSSTRDVEIGGPGGCKGNGIVGGASGDPAKPNDPIANPYVELHGTSQAAPHVAATAALALMFPVRREVLAEVDPRYGTDLKLPIDGAIVKKLLLKKMMREIHVEPAKDKKPTSVKSSSVNSNDFGSPQEPRRFLRVSATRGFADDQVPGKASGDKSLYLDVNPLPRLTAEQKPDGSSRAKDDNGAFDDGVSAYFQGDYVTALERLSVAVNESSHQAFSLYFLAFTKAVLGDLHGADTAFRDACDVDSRAPLDRLWGPMMERFQGPARQELDRVRYAFLRGEKLPEQLPFLSRWSSESIRNFGGNSPFSHVVAPPAFGTIHCPLMEISVPMIPCPCLPSQ